MDNRLKLQSELEALLGSEFVYFQPPESIKLTYPCIVYKRNSGYTRHANNFPYTFNNVYEITIIAKDPDTELVDKMAMAFPGIRYNRHYVTSNLNHDIFSLRY